MKANFYLFVASVNFQIVYSWILFLNKESIFYSKSIIID